jgi:hypothetical protein
MEWPPPPRSALYRGILAAIVTAFVGLCGLYNLATPVFEGSDEAPHYVYLDRLSRQRALPDLNEVASTSYEMIQPPLYYIAGALLTAWIDRPQYSIYRSPDFLAHNVAHESIPQPPDSTVLAVRIARLLSTVLGALTVLLAHELALRLTRQPPMALLAAALTAFNPKFIHLSSVISNDIAVAAFSALCMWMAVALLTRMERPATWRFIVLGACLGLAGLSKYNGLAFIAPVAVTVIWRAARDGGRRWWKPALIWGAATLAGFALVIGPFALHNLAQYGHPLAWEQVARVTAGSLRDLPLDAADILAQWPLVLHSYWGVFGYGIPFPDGVNAVVTALVAVAAIGFGVAVVRRLVPAEALLLLAAIAASFAAHVVWIRNYTNGSENSRFMLPAFGLLAAFAAIGLLAWVPRRRWRTAAVSGAIVLFIAALLVPFGPLRMAYAGPNYLTSQRAAALPADGSVDFDNGIRLVYADITDNRVGPGEPLRVSLYWQATRPITLQYELAIEGFDEQGQSMGRGGSAGAVGLQYVQPAWQAGRVLKQDYALELRADRRAVVDVYAGWYEFRPPGRLVAAGDRGVSVPVARVKVRGPQPPEVKPGVAFSSTFGGVIALEGYDVISGGLTLYWRSLGLADRDYKVFVHTVDAQGRLVVQSDAPVAYPTLYWDRGEQVADPRAIAEQPVAVYRVGLYDPSTGQRLPAFDASGQRWLDDVAEFPAPAP